MPVSNPTVATNDGIRLFVHFIKVFIKKYRGMRIDHIAIWAADIERLKAFYTRYFDLACGDKYTNPTKRFTSYFLSFADGSTRIELMHTPGRHVTDRGCGMAGLAHFSISVGSKEAVDELTERLRNDGYAILSNPRTTGDGYYESTVADTEGNCIEISE